MVSLNNTNEQDALKAYFSGDYVVISHEQSELYQRFKQYTDNITREVIRIIRIRAAYVESAIRQKIYQYKVCILYYVNRVSQIISHGILITLISISRMQINSAHKTQLVSIYIQFPPTFSIKSKFLFHITCDFRTREMISIFLLEKKVYIKEEIHRT